MNASTSIACAHCSATLRVTDRFCVSCGKVRLLSREESLQVREANLKRMKAAVAGVSPVALWNPRAAIWWCLIFSPIFGATIHAMNWSALGDKIQCRLSVRWAAGGFLLFGLGPILSVCGVDDRQGRWIVQGVTLAYWLAWYILSARHQVAHIQASFGPNYQRRSWIKAIGSTLLLIPLFAALAYLASTLFS